MLVLASSAFAAVGSQQVDPGESFRARELLLRAQPRAIRPAERLSLLLAAAKAALPGALAGSQGDEEVYREATTQVVMVLVHGLFSRPEAWGDVLNQLMTDSRIRARYQFWFFLYPTGLPIWHSGMLLRDGLDAFHKALEKHERHPNLHRIVLVGHSMGGLISSLIVRDPGTSLWKSLSDQPLNELDLSPESVRLIFEIGYVGENHSLRS